MLSVVTAFISLLTPSSDGEQPEFSFSQLVVFLCFYFWASLSLKRRFEVPGINAGYFQHLTPTTDFYLFISSWHGSPGCARALLMPSGSEPTRVRGSLDQGECRGRDHLSLALRLDCQSEHQLEK